MQFPLFLVKVLYYTQALLLFNAIDTGESTGGEHGVDKPSLIITVTMPMINISLFLLLWEVAVLLWFYYYSYRNTNTANNTKCAAAAPDCVECRCQSAAGPG